MAQPAADGRRSTPETVAAHKAAYAKGLSGQAAGDAETNDPRLRRSYREGLKASRGAVPVRKSALRQAKPATPADDADAFDKNHAPQAKPAPSVARPSDLPRIRVGASAGGFILGMLAYAVAINYVRYGMAGVKALASAKLFNKVTPGPWSSSTPAKSPGVGEGPGQLPFYLVPPPKAAS